METLKSNQYSFFKKVYFEQLEILKFFRKYHEKKKSFS